MTRTECCFLIILTLLSAGLFPVDRSLGQALVGSIDAFDIEDSDIELTRPIQPDTYFDQTGRTFAILANEAGWFEAWAYPLKLFRDFRFSFYLGSSTEPIESRDIAYRIDVRPEATTLSWVFQSFTVRAHFVTAVREPGAVILLDVDSTEPLSIVASFIPAMEPMWPGGLGGQYAGWDPDLKAYLISESSRKNHGFVGSPAAAGMSYTPAHMLSEQPNQFRIRIEDPESVVNRFIPVVMAGGKGDREDVTETYRSLSSDPKRVYRDAKTHFDELRATTLSVHTPEPEIDTALEWAKVSFDNLAVENPDIPGTGMIAGLARASRGGRPGFGWFFGGDTYINSLSMHALGMFDLTRDAIDFTTQFQSPEGKMPHEVTQAVDYVDWFGDYPYAYIHADTSPYYIVSLHDHYAATGDLEFIRSQWPTVLKAWEWARATDLDGDGLMDNEAAGLGALEFGALTGIQTDIYLGAVWVRSLQALWQLAIAVDDRNTAAEASAAYDHALQAFEQFWNKDIGQYAYAFNEKGNTVEEVSPWSAIGLMFGLGDDERAVRSLRRMAFSDMTTDWGTRMLSTESSYFEPLNYNYGAVWPFLTSWVTTAQYQRGLPLQAYSGLMASIGHVYRGSLGDVNEVFSGARHTWPQESVPHQGFCTAATVLPLVRGMLGLWYDAPSSLLSLAPAVPADWEFWEANGFRAGDHRLDIEVRRLDNRETYRISGAIETGLRMQFRPRYAPGTLIHSVEVNGRAVPFEVVTNPEWVQPTSEFPLEAESEITVTLTRSLEIIPPVWQTDVGDENAGLRIIRFQREGETATLEVEGRSGRTYRLDTRGSALVTSVDGAVWSDTMLDIRIPDSRNRPFGTRTIQFILSGSQ